MRSFTDSEIFYVNSLDRTSGTTSDFTYTFSGLQFDRYDRVVLLSGLIPKSYYIIRSENRTFVLSENDVEVTVTMPVGNYTRTSFRQVLQTQINAVASYTYAITNETIATSQDTGKYTYTVSGNSGVQPKFIFSDVNTLYEQMGFDSGSTNTFSADTLTSSDVINLAQESTIFLKSDIIVPSGAQNNILHAFYTTSQASYGVIGVENSIPEWTSRHLSSKTSDTFRFYLVNENNQQIDLNGQNFVFTLLFYKENNIDRIIKKFIKLSALQ